MDPTNNADVNEGKITPHLRTLDASLLLALLIIAAQIVISIATYPLLPASVPSHWDAAGQVNGYLPKWLNAIFYPGMSLFLLVVLRGAMRISPQLGQASARRANKIVVNMILVALLLFMLVLQLVTTSIALGSKIDVTFVISLAVSVLFIFLGNYLGKLRRNFWAGIRTPWTLASDTVWERTHRLGGWLFVAAGFIGVITSFIPPLRLWGLFVPLILLLIITTAYSYYAYSRYTVDGKEPLSPPFGDE
jgi:uncharacterized membrane protein